MASMLGAFRSRKRTGGPDNATKKKMKRWKDIIRNDVAEDYMKVARRPRRRLPAGA